MILHRLRLTNFRGVRDREITFPDHGVVVVCGPNEIGKSSMLEALDLLLTYRDRSTHRDVKQVKPSNADVGALVEAEITTGPYRFVYRKQFHKKTRTELDILEPRRENLTGDEAHERVEAMLKETLDTSLWDAQRVLQAAATDAVNLSGSDALSRALDAAAGDVTDAASGTDSLLIDLIDTEYERYFTKTGKPARDWKAVAERVNAAEEQVRRCRAAVEDVNERVSRHEQLTATLQALEADLAPAAQRLAAAEKAHAVITELGEQLAQARLVTTAAAATSTNSALANGQRQQLVADAERRGATLVGLHEELAAAEQLQAEARGVAEAAATAAETSGAALAQAQERFDAARAVAEACVAREEADRLAARLQRIDDAQGALAQVTRELDAITLTEAALAEIEGHAGTVERLQAQLDADAGTVEFVAPADLDITVDGATRTLAAGQTWTQPASSPLTVEVPGVLSVRIAPGVSARKLHADLATAQELLGRALTAAGVADIAAAQDLGRRRLALLADQGQATTTLDVLCDGDDVESLRARFAQMQVPVPDGPGVDPGTAAAELSAAEEALRAARADLDARQKVATAAAAKLAESTTGATLLRDRLKTAEQEFAAVHEQLSTLRAAVSDQAVAAQATADAEAQRVADDAVAALAERYAAHDPAAVETDLLFASDAVAALAADRDATTRALNDLTVELGVIGSEGRKGHLDDAESELERARAEYVRIEERACAAQLLRDTMIRHRDNTRQRYVQPYRTELERLGRQVFDSSFEVDVDTELTIQTRTVKGCTVPYDSLSGGAREQLGILARLAGAALVAKEDTVPVIIDDALGFTDPDRLAKMGAVLNTVGDRGQVIVLTCTPGRYDGVADAEVIELTA